MGIFPLDLEATHIYRSSTTSLSHFWLARSEKKIAGRSLYPRYVRSFRLEGWWWLKTIYSMPFIVSFKNRASNMQLTFHLISLKLWLTGGNGMWAANVKEECKLELNLNEEDNEKRERIV